jgi:hypothetical protein
MSILPSAIRPGTESMLLRKQCGLFAGDLIDSVMLVLRGHFCEARICYMSVHGSILTDVGIRSCEGYRYALKCK